MWNLGLLLGGCTEIVALSHDEGDPSEGSSTTSVATTLDPTVTDPGTTSIEPTAPTTIDPSDTDPTVGVCDSHEECQLAGPHNCCLGKCVFVECPENCPPELCCYGMCPPYPCDEDYDCGIGAVCYSDGACMPIEPEPACEGSAFDMPIPIPMPMVGEIRSLAFIDADGDPYRDVVVGESTRLQLLQGYDYGLVELHDGVDAIDVAVGDLDVDGDDDIVIANRSDPSGLRVLLQDAVSFAPIDVASLPGLLAIELVDADADGFPDVVALDDNGVYFVPNLGGMGFDLPVPLGYIGYAVGVGALDGDELGDIVLHDGSTLALTGGLAEATALPDEGAFAPFRVPVVGDFDGTAPDDVIGLQPTGGTTTAVMWASSVLDAYPQRSWWFGTTTVAAVADVDGDGFDDVVAAGGESQLVVAYGEPSPATSDVIGCVTTVVTDLPVVQLAVGDISGDAHVDIVTTDGANLTVLLQP